MKKNIYLLCLLMCSVQLRAQSVYTGFIDKYPVELATDIYSDGDARAVYVYSNFDEPIIIDGKLSNRRLVLFEKDNNNKNSATIVFEQFDGKLQNLTGTWTNLHTHQQRSITLTKSFDIATGDSEEQPDRELIQGTALKHIYFKLVLSKKKDDFTSRVTAVKLFEKKTGKLLQQVELDCQLLGLNNISVDDYNFDGFPDFSVFESSYAGPNTSSLYYLFNPKTNTYFESGFSGVSLEFDPKHKRIYERNQCCAGSIVTTAEYRLVNNKMILVKAHCYKWDEKKQELVERKLKDCD